jgi:anthranilate/para-aminobenzoate synthase component II
LFIMLSSISSQVGELKSKSAVEAAQDPNSRVTAQDAENVMAAESKKAGIAAYQFDPNASPEEKAAAAHAVSLRGTNTVEPY